MWVTLVTEFGRGKGAIDLVGSGGAEEASILIERGIIKPYPWVEVFGVDAGALLSVSVAVVQLWFLAVGVYLVTRRATRVAAS
jgi:hypothetical protein